MKSSLKARDGSLPRTDAGHGIETGFLRLVKSDHERRALAKGEVDAIMDPVSGKAYLLPAAQVALRAEQARLRSMHALSADWCWEMDEFHRLASITGAASAGSGFFDDGAIGKTLRNLPIDNMSEVDWQAYQRQLDWRATLRDIELRWKDRTGAVRWVSMSGEPTFDQEEHFTGYRGTLRDVTVRKESELLEQKSLRLARDILDALAIRICVLDAAGTVVSVNQPSVAGGDLEGGIGAGIREGANFFRLCEKSCGHECEDGGVIAEGTRRVIAGDSALFRHQYVCNSAAGRRWFSLTVTALPEGGAGRAVVARENITQRMREETIQRGARQR